MANTSSRGLGSDKMSEEKKEEIRSKGGRSQGKENNPANFANNPKRASDAGRSRRSRQ
jgi:general stress protein YciG